MVICRIEEIILMLYNIKIWIIAFDLSTQTIN